MKVLVLTHSFPRWPGDASGTHVHAFTEEFARHGHDVHVLAPHYRGAKTREEMKNLSVHRFRYAPSSLEVLTYGGGIGNNVANHPLLRLLLPFLLIAEWLAVISTARRVHADVVHAYGVIFPGWISVLAKPFIRRPIIVTSHGNELFRSTGRRVRRAALSYCLNRADCCIANSSATRKQIGLLSPVETPIVPFGVDTEVFAPESSVPTSEKSDNILFVGQLIEKKGAKVLLEAHRLLTRDLPDLRVTIIGDGAIRSELEQSTRAMGTHDTVTFLGSVPNRDLVSHYRNASVFVLPSIQTSDGDTETLGVVLLEAAACGTPLVASQVGGISDVIEDGITGLLVPPGDPIALANALRRLLTERSLAQRLSSAARARVVDSFSLPRVTAEFEKVLVSTCSVHAAA